MVRPIEDDGRTERTPTVKTDHAEEADRDAGERSPPPSVADVFVQRLGQLKRVVAGMGFAAADAEDILQDVFLATTKARGDFRTADEAGRWLVRVTVNRCVLEFRRRQRFRKAAAEVQRRSSVAPSPAADGPSYAAMAVEDLQAVRGAMQGLDESLLCPLVLRYFCGLDSTQVGEILQVPASTVRSQLREARMILAKRLMQRGAEQ